MEDINSLEELYRTLRPAFLVKIRLLHNYKLNYIKIEDIWNYLKESKWTRFNNLTLSDMVNDIIHCDNISIENYLKEKLKSTERNIYFK